MRNRIQSLTLKNFRGATTPVEIEFNTNIPITMIFGENGTGKSTIVDGLDFVCNENFGSLEEKSFSKSKSTFIASLGANENNISVILKYNNQEWIGKIGAGNKPKSIGPIGIRPKAHILRRSNILKVIDSQPSKRYDALKSYIDVSTCTKNENSLNECCKNMKKDYDKSVADMVEANNNLDGLWKHEDKLRSQYSSLEDWVDAKLKEDKITLKLNAEKVEDFLTLHNLCNEEYKKAKVCKANLKKAKNENDEAKRKLTDHQESVIGKSEDFISLLETAKSYFTKNDSIDLCPLCENEIDEYRVRDSIDQRLDEMKIQIRLRREYEEALREYKKNMEIFEERKKSFANNMTNLVHLFFKSNIKQFLPHSFSKLEAFWNKISINDIDEMSLESAVNALNDISDAEGELRNSKNIFVDQFHHLDNIKKQFENYKSKKRKSELLEKKVKKTEHLLKLISKERKEFVEQVLEDISDVVEKLYEKIHPDEGYGKIMFSLKKNAKGSVEITSHFHTEKNIYPQAYFSESHLDTLGICVFLALAKHYSDGNTIVILDDVITSVDQVHIERFMNMIHEEVSSFSQFIITTHYRPWRDRYRYGIGPSSNVQLIELLHWALPRGIRHTKTKLIVEDLKEKIEENPIDRQGIASKAGVLLESLLDFLTLQFRCKLPRSIDPNYTLGDFLSGLGAKLKKALEIKIKKPEGTVESIFLEPLMNPILETTWIRNQVGCHFNLAGFDIPDNDIMKMGRDTIALAQSLICSDCGQLPSNDRSGSYWACKCGNRNLFPLKSPR